MSAPAPKPLNITPYKLAERFVGLSEVPGSQAHPQVLAMLQLDATWPEDDAVPWCSAFVNYVAWLLRLPRSKSLRARSWLGVGTPVLPHHMCPGFDVVVLGFPDDPGPQTIDARGHVAFFAGWEPPDVWERDECESLLLLGGNQGNSVSVQVYGLDRWQLLGCRRLNPA